MGWQMQIITFRMYSTENYVQSLGVEHNGRQYEKKKNMCVCVCVCVYDWVTMLYNRNLHNIVNQL